MTPTVRWGGWSLIVGLVAACLVAVASPNGDARDDVHEPLLAQARGGNRSSVAAVSTMSAHVTCTVEAGSRVTIYRADYKRSPTTVRVSEKNESGEVKKDVVYRDGIQRALIGVRGGPANNRYLSAVIAREGEIISDMDAWSMGLCYLPHERLTLDELLGRGATLGGVRSVTDAGRKKIRVDLTSSQQVHYEVRIDPAVNYLIDRIDTRFARKDGDTTTDVRSEYVVSSFTEVAPGVFFPARVVSKGLDDGKLVATHTVEFSDVKVNPRHAAGTFDLKFPSGVYVSDKINGTLYQVDGNERPMGKVMKYAPAVSLGGDSPTPVSGADETGWSLARWVAIVSVVVLVAGIVLSLRLRLKTRAAG